MIEIIFGKNISWKLNPKYMFIIRLRWLNQLKRKINGQKGKKNLYL